MVGVAPLRQTNISKDLLKIIALESGFFSLSFENGSSHLNRTTKIYNSCFSSCLAAMKTVFIRKKKREKKNVEQLQTTKIVIQFE